VSTTTIILCYSLVKAFLYPPPEDARGCRRGPAHCPRFFHVSMDGLGYIVDTSNTIFNHLSVTVLFVLLYWGYIAFN